MMFQQFSAAFIGLLLSLFLTLPGTCRWKIDLIGSAEWRPSGAVIISGWVFRDQHDNSHHVRRVCFDSPRSRSASQLLGGWSGQELYLRCMDQERSMTD